MNTSLTYGMGQEAQPYTVLLAYSLSLFDQICRCGIYHVFTQVISSQKMYVWIEWSQVDSWGYVEGHWIFIEIRKR